MEILLFFSLFYLVFDVNSESASVFRWFCNVPADTSKSAGEPSKARLRSREYLLLFILERGLVKLRVFLGIGEIDFSLTDLV